MRVTSKILRWIVALYLAAAVIVVAISRLAKGAQRDRIRRFNRDILNPWMLGRAGSEHWYASVVEHTGRVTGKAYETPVVMHPTPDGFVIPLPYGTGVDWVENLRHASGGVVVHKGVEHAMRDPVLVSRESIADQVGWRDAFRYRALGIDEFLSLRHDTEVLLAM